MRLTAGILAFATLLAGGSFTSAAMAQAPVDTVAVEPRAQAMTLWHDTLIRESVVRLLTLTGASILQLALPLFAAEMIFHLRFQFHSGMVGGDGDDTHVCPTL